MQIIPVIDIKAGQVVLARQGQRQQYRPLSTPLCRSSNIHDVINAYLKLYSFTHLYIADLDALMKTGSNHVLINSLFNHYPDLTFIIDSGHVNSQFKPIQTHQFTPVIGTESINQQDLSVLKQVTDHFILSLDFSAQEEQMGETQLYESPELWPKQLIIMTLGLVGKNSGPDLTKLTHYRNRYPEHKFIAAGGIRDINDLLLLKQIGIETALVASALHNKNLLSNDIQQLQAH